jgi:hypothetical protein
VQVSYLHYTHPGPMQRMVKNLRLRTRHHANQPAPLT